MRGWGKGRGGYLALGLEQAGVVNDFAEDGAPFARLEGEGVDLGRGALEAGVFFEDAGFEAAAVGGGG